MHFDLDQYIDQGINKQGNRLKPLFAAQCRVQRLSKLCASIKRPSNVHCDDRLHKTMIGLFKVLRVQNLGENFLLCKREKENNCYGLFRYFRHLSIIPEKEKYNSYLSLQMPLINFDNSLPNRETWKILKKIVLKIVCIQ